MVKTEEAVFPEKRIAAYVIHGVTRDEVTQEMVRITNQYPSGYIETNGPLRKGTEYIAHIRITNF